MKLDNQINQGCVDVPLGFEKMTVSKLIDHGLITDLCEGGFPLHTPIGSIILNNIESIFEHNALRDEFNKFGLPNAMKTSVLEKGQEIGDQFRSKLMELSGSLQDYHVMSTHEAKTMEWQKKYQASYKQLPIRNYYIDELHRHMPYTRGSLISRQIRIFGGISIEENGHASDGIEAIKNIVSDSLAKIGLPVHVEQNYKGFDYEFFHLTQPKDGVIEGENIVLPGIDKDKRVKAFSVGMIYNYPMEGEWKMRYRSAFNKNANPELITFGFCTQRVLYCLMMSCRDEKGFNLPEAARPFNYYIIPCNENDLDDAEHLYKNLRSKFNGFATPPKVALDNRFNRSIDQRCKSSDYIGAPVKLLVKDGAVMGISRDGTRTMEPTPIEQAKNVLSL